MPLDLRHQYVSDIPDTGDDSIVQGSNWNEAHNLTQSGSTLLGRPDATAGPTLEVELDPATMAFTVDGKLSALGGGIPDWADITGKPATFPPTIPTGSEIALWPYLPLTGGTLSGPGNLIMQGRLNATGLGTTWPTTSAGGHYWGTRDSHLQGVSPGLMAVSGFSRASDKTVSSPELYSTIGISGFVIADAPAPAGTWAGYLDVQREAGSGFAFGLEVAVKNKGSSVTETPYLNQGGAAGIWLAGGGAPEFGGAPANPNNYAISIGRNGHTWNTGIVFKSNGLTGTTGSDADAGSGQAIALARTHQVSWYDSANRIASYLTSRVTTAGPAQQLSFGDGGVNLVTSKLGVYGTTTAPGVTIDTGPATTANIGTLTNMQGYFGYANASYGGVLLGAGLNGNTPTVAASRTSAGTALPLALYTADTQRVFISTAGNVGINNPSPSRRLDIIDNANSGTGLTVANSDTGIAAQANILLTSSGGSLGLYAQGGGFTSSGVFLQDAATIYAGSTLSGGLAIGCGASAPLTFFTAATSRMTISGAGDITLTGALTGTTASFTGSSASPAATFNVYSTATAGTVADAMLLGPSPASSTTGAGARLYLSGATSTGRGAYIEGVISNVGNAHDLVLGTNAGSAVPVERLRITSAGVTQLSGGLTATSGNFSGSVEIDGNLGVGQAAAVNKVDIVDNVNAASYLRHQNQNTGASSTIIWRTQISTKYVDRTLNYTANSLQEVGSVIVTRYSDFDTHQWRSNAGAALLALDATGLAATGTVFVRSATAVASATATQFFVKGSNTTNPFGVFYGSGVPAFVAQSGSIYLRSDGAANTRLYIYTTAWAAVTTP